MMLQMLSRNPVSDSYGDDALAECDPHNEPVLSITEPRMSATMPHKIQYINSCTTSYYKTFQTIAANFHNHVDPTGMPMSTFPLMIIWLFMDVVF